jgi:hypothetical protein
MKTKIATILLAGLLAVLAIGWVVQGNDYFLFKVFNPRMEAVRRSTFEQSKAYNQGMIQDLYGMEAQYVAADEGGKDALASLILHRYADYPDEKLPADLQGFMRQLRARKHLNQ